MTYRVTTPSGCTRQYEYKRRLFYYQQLAERGGIAGAQLLPFHHPFPAIPAAGREVDLSQLPLVNLVDDLH